MCALECCSRFWRELCASDCIWESLTRQRWPLLSLLDAQTSAEEVVLSCLYLLACYWCVKIKFSFSFIGLLKFHRLYM